MKDNFLTAVANFAGEDVTRPKENTVLTNKCTTNLDTWLLCGCAKSLLQLGSMSLGKICRT
jgi:hypothetical protein